MKLHLVSGKWNFTWFLENETSPGFWKMKLHLVSGKWNFNWFLENETSPGFSKMKLHLVSVKWNFTWFLENETSSGTSQRSTEQNKKLNFLTFQFNNIRCLISSKNNNKSSKLSFHMSQKTHPLSRFRDSAITEMRTALFWDITQRVMVIPYRRFGTTCR